MTAGAYPRERIEKVLDRARLPESYRIIPYRHLETPLGTAPAAHGAQEVRFAPSAEPLTHLRRDVGCVEGAEGRFQGAAAGEQGPAALLVRMTGEAPARGQQIGSARYGAGILGGGHGGTCQGNRQSCCRRRDAGFGSAQPLGYSL